MDHLSQEQLWNLKDGESSSSEKAAAMGHLETCTACKEQWEIISSLDIDILNYSTPEVPPEFALKVTARIRDLESVKLFDRPPFKIFRVCLTVLIVLLFTFVFLLLNDKEYHFDSSQFQVTGGVYYLMAGVCLAFVFILDKLFLQSRNSKL